MTLPPLRTSTSPGFTSVALILSASSLFRPQSQSCINPPKSITVKPEHWRQPQKLKAPHADKCPVEDRPFQNILHIVLLCFLSLLNSQTPCASLLSRNADTNWWRALILNILYGASCRLWLAWRYTEASHDRRLNTHPHATDLSLDVSCMCVHVCACVSGSVSDPQKAAAGWRISRRIWELWIDARG